MRPRGRILVAGLWLCSLALGLAVAATGVEAQAPASVLRLQFDGAIGPASQDYLQRGLQRARDGGAGLLLLQLDTPGGLDSAMREMIKAILASPVPVAVYVAPSGARAASAGTYLLYASHVAAMAPATTLGAATPVAIPATPSAPAAPASAAHDPLEAKRISDAVAYIRGLAQLRGRNVQWAESAVREATSLPAAEALKLGVIDLVADDLPELLRRVDGRTVTTAAGPVKLATAASTVQDFELGWRGRVLATIGNPNLALILMMIGLYGLLFEFASPGLIAPGVIGAVCLLLGLYGLQTLPIDQTGFALVLLGLAFLVAEAFVPSYGVLGLGGIVAFSLGALMLIDDAAPGFGVSPLLVASLAATSLAVVLGIAWLAGRSRSRPLASGRSTLLGRTAEVIEVGADGSGWVLLDGERWRARAAAPLQAGTRVRVTGADGFVLEVEGVR